MHHGDRDQVVVIEADRLLAALLTSLGVPNDLVVYPGAEHDDVAVATVVLDRVRAWYAARGLF
jgi:dipeptidyl aminopeptidase/acylaminoacyl peptidase